MSTTDLSKSEPAAIRSTPASAGLLDPRTVPEQGVLGEVVEPVSGSPDGTVEERRSRHSWARTLRRVSTPLVLLALWQIAAGTNLINVKLFASPWLIAQSFGTLLSDGQLEKALLVSLGRVAGGLALGVPTGLLLGLISGLSKRGEDLVDPSVQMIRTVPVIALSGVIIVWFGIGEMAKVVIIALACFFPVYINMFSGIRSVDAKLVEVGRTAGLSRWGLVRHVILPGALPNALVGLRYALGLSWLVLFFAEQDNAQSGIGFLMTQAQQDFQVPIIFVGMIVYALLGLSADLLVRGIERKALSWRTSFSGA